MNFDSIIALVSGLILGLVIHAILWIRMEHIHGAELSQEYKAGKNEGYNQCHGEMVAPLLHEFERKTGVRLNWEPLQQPCRPVVPTGENRRVLIVSKTPPPQLMPATH